MQKTDSRYLETLENVRRALTDGHNSAVAETFDESSDHAFLIEMNSKDRQYFVKLRIDHDIECLIMEIHPSITVGEPYKRMFNQYAMMKNRSKKIGNIRIGGGCSVEIHLESSFTSGPITVEEYNRLEHIGMQFTFSVEDELDLIAHGIIPDSEDDDDKPDEAQIREALDHLFHHDSSDKAGSSSEESDDEDDSPFGDFLSFLASHASQSDDSDDDSIIDVESSEDEAV